MTKKTTLTVTIIAASVLLLVAAGWLMWSNARSTYRLSEDIKNQAGFAVYVPAHNPLGYELDQASVKWSKMGEEGIINFVLVGDNHTVTISQQPYPDILIYEKFTNSLGPDDEVGTDLGKLTIGHPADAKGAQVAGMKVGDTLLLGRPTTDLSPDDWRSIMNSLEQAR